MKPVTAALLMLLTPCCAARAAPPATQPARLDGAEPGGLYEAVVTGDAGAVTKLLASGAKPDANRDRLGGTRLIEAASRGNVEIMKLLIGAGADVNAEAKSGFCPLQSAADGGHLEAAALLIAKGAGVRHRDRRGGTPLYDAVAFSGSKAGDLGGGSLEIAKLLIEKGADVNATLTNTGGAPLHCAVEKGNKQLVELLMAKGADVNAKERYVGTPLRYARSRAEWTKKPEFKAVADVLVAHGGRDEGPDQPATKPAAPPGGGKR